MCVAKYLYFNAPDLVCMLLSTVNRLAVYMFAFSVLQQRCNCNLVCVDIPSLELQYLSAMICSGSVQVQLDSPRPPAGALSF